MNPICEAPPVMPTMILLDHPCYGVDVYTPSSADELPALRAQGYINLEILRVRYGRIGVWEINDRGDAYVGHTLGHVIEHAFSAVSPDDVEMDAIREIPPTRWTEVTVNDDGNMRTLFDMVNEAVARGDLPCLIYTNEY